MIRIQTYINERDAVKIEQIAEREDRSVSQVVARLIAKALNSRSSKRSRSDG